MSLFLLLPQVSSFVSLEKLFKMDKKQMLPKNNFVIHSSKSLLVIEAKKKKMKSLSRVQFFAIPWTLAYQASQSMGFSRQEYWNRLPFPSPGDLPDPGIEPKFPALHTDVLPS